MGWFSNLFKSAGKLSGEITDEAIQMNKVFNSQKAFPSKLADTQFKSNGAPYKKFAAQHEAYTGAVNAAHEEASSINFSKDTSLFKSNSGVPGLTRGALTGAGFAVGGSLIYGGVKAMSPNNADVENPFRNAMRGAMAGAGAAALMMASHNASGANFVKAAKTSDSWWLNKAAQYAPGVKSFMNSNLAKGALGAALVAGSGQFDLTRPVNPVY